MLTTLLTAEDPEASHHAASERPDEMVSIGEPAALPPGELLPPGGTDHRGEAPIEGAWASKTFQRRVAAVHRQLAPVASRAALVESYGREAARRLVRQRAVGRRSTTALQVAYALRWLELGSTGSVPITWADLLDARPG